MRHGWLAAVWFAMAAWAAIPARADSETDRAAIVERLEGWAAAFNARDVSGVCNLFASNLVSTVPGTLDGNRDAVCRRLSDLLAKPGLRARYSPDIREIIVSGNIAVVRLFWTLTAVSGADQETSREAGMDIFERQRDGKWAISRFVAFTVEPNTTP